MIDVIPEVFLEKTQQKFLLGFHIGEGLLGGRFLFCVH